jgi:hypothetical protein
MQETFVRKSWQQRYRKPSGARSGGKKQTPTDMHRRIALNRAQVQRVEYQSVFVFFATFCSKFSSVSAYAHHEFAGCFPRFQVPLRLCDFG